MKITKIEAQKNSDRVNIYIDDEFAFGLNDEIRYKYNLKSGLILNQEFIDDILKEEEKNKAMNQTLNYLSYRERSEKEIIDYLKRKDYPDYIIDEVVEKCKYFKYIDDNSFAQNFTKDRINLKKYGSFRIKQELNQKGISQDIINNVVDIDSDKEYEMALTLAKKRINSYKNDDYNAKYRKLSGYLQRRGYSFSIINKVLKDVITNE